MVSIVPYSHPSHMIIVSASKFHVSVIVKTDCETDGSFTALVRSVTRRTDEIITPNNPYLIPGRARAGRAAGGAVW